MRSSHAHPRAAGFPTEGSGPLLDRWRKGATRPRLRLALWPLLTLVLMLISFVVGRSTGGLHMLPRIVATLPGEETEFSHEFDKRMRERFPVGADEDKLIAYLDAEKFLPEWRRRDDSNRSVFVWNGLLCKKIVRVSWRADATGLLTEVGGTYESQCL
jgi:hypothetical protein